MNQDDDGADAVELVVVSLEVRANVGRLTPETCGLAARLMAEILRRAPQCAYSAESGVSRLQSSLPEGFREFWAGVRMQFLGEAIDAAKRRIE